jgi:isoquinoline 1-oxidoreductase subunit beta
MARDEERPEINRRTLLIGGGVGVGLVIAWSLWPRDYASNLRAAPGEAILNAFLKIGRDGRVIVAVPQAEIGQGSWTSLPQILADELGANWRTVAVEPAPISPLYANLLLAEEVADDALPSSFRSIGRWAAKEFATRGALMLTGGSSSVRAFEPRLREAGAAARALLSMAAAERWGVDWEQVDTRDGFVIEGARRLPFAELAEAAAETDLPDDLPVRGGIENRLTGQPLPRLDAPAKLDGSALFAGDIRLPDIVYAAVCGAPKGSRLIGVDRDAANQVHGAIAIFQNPEWVGAAAINWWAAARAVEAMRPRFAVPQDAASDAGIEQAIATAIERDRSRRLFSQGDLADAEQGARRIDAQYAVGPAPGAPIEPLTATARMTDDRLEIWAPTQAPGLARAAVARAIGLPDAQVTVYPTMIGGGYGRKIEMDAIAQVAVMAERLRRPVQLVWPRIEEIRRDRPRPPAVGLMRAWMGQNGVVRGWQARIVAPPAASQTARRLSAGSRLMRPDGAAAAGAIPPYAIPNVEVRHIPVDIGLETGIWRSGAHSYTVFFTESLIDEMARAAGIEPLSFRMQMLGNNPRLARALATATSLGGWDGGPSGSGMGIAAHSAHGSHIATLAEVEIGRDGRPRVLRAVCAVDCGRVINPDIVRQQIEGGLVHGISGALGAPLSIFGGEPTARTIDDLGLPLLRDAPEITVEIVESEEEPGGVTELAVPTAAPAIANALHSLTGERVRELPIVLGGGQ